MFLKGMKRSAKSYAPQKLCTNILHYYKLYEALATLLKHPNSYFQNQFISLLSTSLVVFEITLIATQQTIIIIVLIRMEQRVQFLAM